MIAAAGVTPAGEAQSERPFDGVVAADGRRLYSLAQGILRDAGEAEDAVQETLLKTWRSWGSVSHMDHPSAWMTRVCVNHCLNRRRLLRSRGWPPLDLNERTGSSPPGTARAALMDIDHAYRRLSLKQRAAITLNYWHGYSVEECAVFMGCRPGTVRTHLARALENLRKELIDD